MKYSYTFPNSFNDEYFLAEDIFDTEEEALAHAQIHLECPQNAKIIKIFLSTINSIIKKYENS